MTSPTDQWGVTMQADGGDSPAQGQDGPSKNPRWLERVKTWDSEFSVTKGLTVVTVLTGFLGGYFQYLNAYDEKVSAQAKDDMAAATATFVEISNSFAQAQLLQQLIYFDLRDVLNDKSDDADKAMSTKNAREIFPDYLKARNLLRQNKDVLARKAEIYVDWASDLKRDPATARPLDADPLSEVLLGNYNFNCDSPINLPHFGNPDAKRETPKLFKDPETPKKDVCVPETKEAADKKEKEDLKESEANSAVRLCARDDDGNIVASHPVTINWLSARHQVLTMHYCFEVGHRTIETARVWAASTSDLSEERKSKFLDKEEMKRTKSRLDSEVIRLDAFMSLVMSQLERIRVKYRPVGFVCHIPLVRDAIGLFSNRCTPIRTAVSESE
jgi:hypothetical protein